MNKSNKILLTIIILFLILRLLVLFSSDMLFVDYFECIKGTMANDLTHHKTILLFDYDQPYKGTSVIYGLLAAPFYLISQNGLWVKVIALLFSIVSLILIHKTLEKQFSLKTASLFSLFYILSPLIFTYNNLIATGYNITFFFTAVFLFLLYRIKDNSLTLKDKNILSKTNLEIIILGILSGISIWAFYTNAVFVGVTFFLLIYYLKELKPILIYLASTIIGLIPLIYFNITRNFSGAIIESKTLGSSIMNSNILSKIIDFFAKDFPNSLFFQYNIMNYIYYLIALFAVIIFIIQIYKFKSKRKILKQKPTKYFEKNLPIVSFFAIYLFVYFITSFNVIDWQGFDGYRYFTPIFPLMFMMLAISFSILLTKTKKFSLALIAIILVIGLIGNIAAIHPNNFSTNQYRPYCYEALGWKGYDCTNLDGKQQQDCLLGKSAISGWNNLDCNDDICEAGRGWYIPYLEEQSFVKKQSDCQSETCAQALLFSLGMADKNYCHEINCLRGYYWKISKKYSFHDINANIELCNNDLECYRTIGINLGFRFKHDKQMAIDICNRYPRITRQCVEGVDIIVNNKDPIYIFSQIYDIYE